MKKLLFVLVAISLSSVMLGSNMGFKLTTSLNAVDANSSVAANVVSVPYFWLADSAAIWSDLVASSITPGLISVWDPTTATTCDYWADPMGFDCNASMVAGQAIFVAIADATNKNWVIVGSHNPAADISLIALDGAGSVAANVVSYPYHGTATDSAGVWAELVAKGITPGLISVWDSETALTCDYWADPMGFDCNSPIAPGAGMFVAIADATNKLWRPNHY